jgi:hypothetical protein
MTKTSDIVAPSTFAKYRIPILVGAAVGVALVVILFMWFFKSDPGASPFGQVAIDFLKVKSVQDDLKMTPEQLAQLPELEAEWIKGMDTFGMRYESEKNKRKKMDQQNQWAEKAVAKLLDAEQFKRLQQIYVQRAGREAWNDSFVINHLKLTAQQRAEIKTIQSEADKARQELFRPPGGNRNNPPPKQDDLTDEQRQELRQKQQKETQKRMDEWRKGYEEKLMAVLSPEQQSTWEEMHGPAFKDLNSLPRVAGGGGRQGGFGGPGGFGP